MHNYTRATRNYLRATSNWTGRFPRTMEEAFGPGTRFGNAPLRKPSRLSQTVGFILACLLCGGLLAYAFIVATNP